MAIKTGKPLRDGSGRGVRANRNTGSCLKGKVGFGKGGGKGLGTGRKK